MLAYPSVRLPRRVRLCSPGKSSKRQFLLLLARAWIRFGAPTHRLESIMIATASALQLAQVRFIILPATMLVSFGDGDEGATSLQLIREAPGLDLGRLSRTYEVYKDITHGRKSAREGLAELREFMSPDYVLPYSKPLRVFFGFAASFLVCPMAFGGSIIDASVAGLLGGFVAFLSLYAASRSEAFAVIYEYVAAVSSFLFLRGRADAIFCRISAVMGVSFISQALSSIQNEGYFCYSAISTASVVTVLPGFLIRA